VRVVALLDTIAEAAERSRLIGVSAVDEEARFVALQAESEVDVVAVAVGDVFQAELVEFVVYFGIAVLEEVLFALKDSQRGGAETTGAV